MVNTVPMVAGRKAVDVDYRNSETGFHAG